MRRAALALSAISLALLVAVLLAEGAFRLLPVFGGIYLEPVDDANPVARMEPDRDFIYSLRPSMSRATPKRVNNAGFVDAEDYHADAPGPLLAVIGDSFVEALMVPHPETLTGRLRQAAEGQARVYSFAISGAPLSQYLVWARHARERYGADALAFVVVGNDFDQSLRRYMAREGYHYFDGDLDACAVALQRIDLPPSRVRWIVKNSALVRYLVFNVGITSMVDVNRLRALIGGFRAGKAAGETAAAAPALGNGDDSRRAHSICAIRAFFDHLPKMAGLPPDRIAFVLDGLRVYGPPVEGGYFWEMRQVFMAEAASRGYEVLDMDPVFADRFARTGIRFEFPDDNHWSGEGHGAAAAAFMETDLWRRLPSLGGGGS